MMQHPGSRFKWIPFLLLAVPVGGCDKADSSGAPKALAVQTRVSRSIPPMTLKAWQAPEEMPTPSEVLTGEDWARRWEEVRSRMDLTSRERSSEPEIGLRILQVVGGLQADQGGVKVGDNLVEFDGKPVRSVPGFDEVRGERGGTLSAWSPDLGRYSLKIKPGRIGIDFRLEWHPVMAYVRSRSRNPKWDAFVAGAAVAFQSGDLEIAETALHHASRAGYRGWVGALILARTHLVRGRPVDALNCGWFAREEVPENQKDFLLLTLYEAAMLSGQWGLAFKISRESDLRASNGWEGGAPFACWKGLSDQERLESSPCTVAASGSRPLQPLQPGDPNSTRLVELFRDTGRASVDLTPPKNCSFVIGPGARHAHFLVDAELQAFEPRLEDYPAEAAFSLLGVSRGIEEEIVSVHFRPGEIMWLEGWGMQFSSFAGRVVYGKPAHRFELAVRGRVCEVRLNDQCILLAPLESDPERRVFLKASFSNIRGAINRLEVTHLDEPKGSPGPAVPGAGATAPLVTPAKPANPRLAWYHKNVVEGYLERGRRNPAWDQMAVDGLALFVPFLENYNYHFTDLVAMAAKLDSALASGCDDALVVFAAAKVRGLLHADAVEEARGYRRAVESSRKSGYPASLRCYLLVTAHAHSGSPTLEVDRQQAESLHQEALALLPAAVSERDVPGEVLVDMMVLLRANYPRAGKDSDMAFHRVLEAAEKGKPRKAVLLAYKGDFYLSYAWEARGSGWSNEVTEEGWKLFQHRLQLAATALEEAWTADPQDGDVPARMVRVALGHEPTRNNLKIWMDRALAASPNNRGAIANLIWLLAPRWHGSDAALRELGRECFESAKRDHLDPCMGMSLIQAHETLNLQTDTSRNGVVRSEEYWRTDPAWSDVRSVFEWILEKYPDSVYYRSLYAFWACKAHQWAVARTQFEQLGDRLVPSCFGGEIPAAQLRLKATVQGK